MTTLLCARPDCDRPRRDSSIYCSDRCSQLAYKIRRRRTNIPICIELGCTNPKHGNGKYCRTHVKHTGHTKHLETGVHKPHRAVEIIDPLVAVPYFISRREWDENFKAYRALGCEAVINGNQDLITPCYSIQPSARN